jgi:hypothetical protein
VLDTLRDTSYDWDGDHAAAKKDAQGKRHIELRDRGFGVSASERSHRGRG